jgi:hypothetical protein
MPTKSHPIAGGGGGLLPEENPPEIMITPTIT